jgi:hypothetical protein
MDRFERYLNQLTAHLAELKSVETKAIRIDRTGLKQWQKSAQLRQQIKQRGEPPLKWDVWKKTMDLREHRP